MLDERVLGWDKVRRLDELSPGTSPTQGLTRAGCSPGSLINCPGPTVPAPAD